MARLLVALFFVADHDEVGDIVGRKGKGEPRDGGGSRRLGMEKRDSYGEGGAAAKGT